MINPDKGPFKDMTHYDVYGPTIIATNEPVHKILDTRCIPITMPNKPGEYENPTPGEAQGFKERLIAWRARTIDTPLPEIDVVNGLSGRFWDISKPLLQVCKLVYPDHYEELIIALLEISGQRVEDKKDSIEGQIIEIIEKLSPEGEREWEITTSKVLEELNSGRPEGRKCSPQWLGKKLKSLGFHKRISHGHSVLTIKRDELETLLYQYGLCETLSPLSPLSPNQEISMGYEGESAVKVGPLSPTLTDSHQPESSMDKGSGEYGESGESYDKVVEEKIIIQGEI